MHNTSRQTHSLWMDASRPSYPSLTRDIDANVCIVGAGIAGLTTAYMLCKEGKSVVVLESKEIGGGETQRTTAHLSNALDDRLYEIERVHGIDGARMAVESHGKAIDLIEKIVADEGIDCDFKRVDGYLFCAPNQPRSIVDDELETAKRIGWKTVERLEKAPIDFDTGLCLRFPDQGQFHPIDYLTGLSRAVMKLGGRIYTHAHVSSIEEDQAPFIVKTSDGAAVRCAQLIVATNAPINDNASIYSKQAPYRTFVISLRVPAASVTPALYWDTLDPYHYVRVQADPQSDKHDLLIVGGEDHRSGAADDMDARHEKLEAWTRKRFPQAGEVRHRWSGQVMETLDGLALIGRKPHGNAQSYIATGDSGMGMTHGTIAGILLTDLIMDRHNPWAELYDPSRTPLKAVKEFMSENMDTAKHAVKDWVKGSEVKDDTDLKPGEGAVVRDGLKKIALYRDDDGTLHRLSAVCPHKGCIVSWNGGEQAWDCPCHGSRYDALGTVLNGPSRAPLEKAD